MAAADMMSDLAAQQSGYLDHDRSRSPDEPGKCFESYTMHVVRI
ncbi:hypothetical protein AB1K62_07320 [Parasphingorhabdus sp. JC815]